VSRPAVARGLDDTASRRLCQRRLAAPPGRLVEPEVTRGDLRAGRQDDRPVHGVLQFADGAGPGVLAHPAVRTQENALKNRPSGRLFCIRIVVSPSKHGKPRSAWKMRSAIDYENASDGVIPWQTSLRIFHPRWQQAVETDRKKREAMLHQIQQTLHDRVRFAPIFDFIWPSCGVDRR
jgi:hypothetical protein